MIMSRNGLIATLKRCQDLLENVGETFWSRKIKEFVTACDESPCAEDARDVLSWYGGMGSFNDLMVASLNGHHVKPEDEAEYNDQLDRLRETIFTEASKML